jgi:hypothetical protein
MTVVNDEIFDRRLYDDYPYLVLNKKLYKIKLGDQLPTLRAFVYQKANLFGDSTPYNLAGYDIKFNLYNQSRAIVSSGIALVSDLVISEIEYKIKKMDVIESGEYYGEFVFTNLENENFSLPTADERQKIHLIVID